MKVFKTKLFFFILGVLVTFTSTVFAYSYLAEEVGFSPTDTNWVVDNTQDALDDLYDLNKYSVRETLSIRSQSCTANGYIMNIKNGTYKRGDQIDGEHILLRVSGQNYLIYANSNGVYYYQNYTIGEPTLSKEVLSGTFSKGDLILTTPAYCTNNYFYTVSY